MTKAPPSGTITLVFTDLEDSTRLREEFPREFVRVQHDHFRIVRDTAARYQAYEDSTAGDSFFLIFEMASDGVQFAVDLQQAFAAHEWPLPPESQGESCALRIRIGAHTADLEPGEDRGRPAFHDRATNLAARIMSKAQGGQILVSDTVRTLAVRVLPSEFTFLDLGAHPLKGFKERVRLWQVGYPGLRSQFPRLPTPDDLPLSPYPHVGRCEELMQWRELLLRPETRLLTLHGPGGIGKTRTALELARMSLEAFQDGVCWIDLQEAVSSGEIYERLAYSLGLKPQKDESAEEVIRHLSGRKQLLVLDNTEQIPNSGKVIAKLLAGAREVKCVVTTRVALNLRGERRVAVTSLPVADAVALFTARAEERSGFELDETTREDVEQLCSLLDGVPLALTLAASQTHLLSPAAIRKRFAERLGALKTQDSEDHERHMSLQATLDWSYDLLTDSSCRSLFGQLSVFARGFTLEDLEAVCPAGDVFDQASSLIDAALLSEVDVGSADKRFLMLEPIRQYAASKFLEDPACEVVISRHLAHFSSIGQKAETRRRTPDEAEALRILERNFENLRLALVRSLERIASGRISAEAEIESSARLCLAFGWFLERRGFWQLALELTDRAVVTLKEKVSKALLPNLLSLHAELFLDVGRFEDSRRLFDRSSALFKELGDRSGEANCLNFSGVLAQCQGDLEKARSLLERSLELRRALGEDANAGACLTNLGTIAARRGDPAQARSNYEESRSLAKRAGDKRGLAAVELNLGVIAYAEGDDLAAFEHYYAGLKVWQEFGDRAHINHCLFNLAEVLERMGDLERAGLCFVVAHSVYVDLRSPYAELSAAAIERLKPQVAEPVLEVALAALRDVAAEASSEPGWSAPEAKP